MNDPFEIRDSKGKRVGAIFVIIYCALFAALFVWGTFRLETTSEVHGMVVDFGIDESTGSGEQDTDLADDYVLPEAQNQPQTEAVQTQQAEEAPSIEEGNIVTNPKVEKTVQNETEESPAKEELRPREVNPKAMFPGNTPESASASQGAAEGAGNQGYIGGTKSDNYEGNGDDSGFEPDWDLGGRRPRNEFLRPKYSDVEQGLVVVEIWVNEHGDVIRAAYQAKGSTVSVKSVLVNEALRVAYQAKFDESEQDLQQGTITYAFTLNTGAKK